MSPIHPEGAERVSPVITNVAPCARALLATAPPPHLPEEGREKYLRLDMNEDLSGPLVRTVLPRGQDLAMYPTTHTLQRTLSAQLGLPPECIRVTAGADEGIYGLMRAFVGEGETVVLPWPTFVEFPTAAAAVGAEIIKVRYDADLRFPLEQFRAELAHGPRAAVLVTPGNPTGDLIPPDVVRSLAARAPKTLIIVDEAYYEYGKQSILEDGAPPTNVAVIRTFSKAYGLAAARVGYVVAHPAIQHPLRQVLPGYSLAGPSLAMATVGLAAQEQLARRVHRIQSGQQRIKAWGSTHGITVHTTAANFVLLRLSDDAQAQTLVAALAHHGVLVADRTAVLPGTLRVTVGAPRHVGQFLHSLEQVLGTI